MQLRYITLSRKTYFSTFISDNQEYFDFFAFFFSQLAFLRKRQRKTAVFSSENEQINPTLSFLYSFHWICCD